MKVSAAALATLGLVTVVLANPAHGNAYSHVKRHTTVAQRLELIERSANSTAELTKRVTGARATYYVVGGAAGACGQFDSPEGFTVALNGAQYGGGYPGPHCWEPITIKYRGRTAVAQITDKCPPEYCSWGQLDLTYGLFKYLSGGDPDQIGTIYVDWEFGDNRGDNPKPEPKPPKKTSTWIAPPKETRKPKPESHKEEEKPKTTSSRKPKAVTNTSARPTSSASPTPTSTSSPTPTPTIVPPAVQGNIAALEQVVLNLAGLINIAVTA